MKEYRNYSVVIICTLCAHFLLNLLINAFNVIPNIMYYRGILLIEIIITFVVIIVIRKARTKDIVLLLIIVGVQLVSYVMTILMSDYFCFDIHRLIIFILMVVVFYLFPRYSYIDKSCFSKLLNLLLVIGFIACIYNFFINLDVLKTFNIGYIMNYTHKFMSFLGSRSSYSLLLSFDCVICLYLIRERKNKLYLLLTLFFLSNIILTNARTSIITIVVVLVYDCWSIKKDKFKKIILAFGCFTILLLIPWQLLLSNINLFAQKYPLLFMHGHTADFSNGRIGLLKDAIEGTNFISFFIGHGIGSKDVYLTYIGNIMTSFHSSWIDLFFEGGIFLLCIYIYFSNQVIKTIKNSQLIDECKLMFIEFFIILYLAGIGDAVALPFMLDSSVLLSTVLIFTVPICVINGSKITTNEIIKFKL